MRGERGTLVTVTGKLQPGVTSKQGAWGSVLFWGPFRVAAPLSSVPSAPFSALSSPPHLLSSPPPGRT